MPWMILTILRNLFSTPATRLYPYRKRESFAGARGCISFDPHKCDLCNDCGRVCPGKAIIVDAQRKRIEYYPFNCIYCGTCVDTCLQHAITQDKQYAPPMAEKQVVTTEIFHTRY
jgi:ech hydrogenase subunit F